MNYRHHFHAGNFADAMKHVLLVALLRSMQGKPKGFLFLDTHAGRGSYDLLTAASGDSLARQPEWPNGIGRLWSHPSGEIPAGIADYLELVRGFDRSAGNFGAEPRFYPGSPVLARLLARPVDRLALCEQHPIECGALRRELSGTERASVHGTQTFARQIGFVPTEQCPFWEQDVVGSNPATPTKLKTRKALGFALWVENGKASRAHRGGARAGQTPSDLTGRPI